MISKDDVHEEDGVSGAEVPSLAGHATEGEPLPELNEHLKETFKGILDVDIDMSAL